MGAMFTLATDFDQPIGNWNTAVGPAMNVMFLSAVDFQSDIVDGIHHQLQIWLICLKTLEFLM